MTKTLRLPIQVLLSAPEFLNNFSGWYWAFPARNQPR